MLTTKKPSQFSPLALAYIGDGVYELFVRTRIIEEHENLPANKLHKKTVQYVKAHAQSNSIDAMLEHMTDDETAVYKRGRNAKSNTVPKNAFFYLRRFNGHISVLLLLSKQRCFRITNRHIQYRIIICFFNVFANSINQPQQIIRTAGSNSFFTTAVFRQIVPPMQNIPLNKLTGSSTNDVYSGSMRCKHRKVCYIL